MTNSNKPIVIIGAGHAGGRLALALRQEGYEGALTLIGEEVFSPYERPPLSKQLLLGQAGAEDCYLDGNVDYAGLGIELKLGTRVTGLDPKSHSIRFSDATRLDYDKLVLATGGRARQVALPGIELDGIHVLRTLTDAARLSSALAGRPRLVVIGGGFIGLEVAASARTLGCDVCVLEASVRLAERVLPPQLSERLLSLHRARGVEVLLGSRIEAIEGQGTVEAVRLQDGSRIPCDLVLVGVGIEPNIELAQLAGLDMGNGIRVNDRLQTSAADIYAIGDVCEFPCPQSQQQVRHETWRNAEAQAHLVARNLLGRDEAYQARLWFWSDQFDCGLQMAGDGALGARRVQRDLPDNALLLFDLDADNRLVAVSGFARGNAIARDIKLGERLIDSGKCLDPEALSNPAISLKALLKA
ncbi:hypothetical protein A8C75_03260 [Marinobacterium aestuarii]|uniref:Pyridine nucleotide-disulfide oxidoreductase n=1 Tax=Marinobacterium aestuarii TaxID=1821621 RepID=A0A1A9F529_9GAMM|nr:FAD-dependent oxidoreductase [Marinobacterium aestuarii]ANG65080.1 hypothetical protein A8C75_03260 [Marinobacterium aestuarii]